MCSGLQTSVSPCVKLEFWNSYLYCDVHSFDSCSDSETETSAEATFNATVALQPEVKPFGFCRHLRYETVQKYLALPRVECNAHGIRRHDYFKFTRDIGNTKTTC